MRLVRQLLPGLVTALVSIAIILGGLSLAFAEGGMLPPTQPKPPTETPSETPIPPLVTTQPASPSLTTTSTLTPSPSLTSTCLPPPGWAAYVVESGDTLETLAARYKTTVETLAQANCLVETSLEPGDTLYVPPLATRSPTRTPTPCRPPYGWVHYPVQPGDTLYHIADIFGVTVRQLQDANCMGNSTYLKPGQWIYVPPWLPSTLTPTGPTPTPTATWTVITPDTQTPTGTDTPTGTPTPTLSPTNP
jgi:LysM repeat protein